ncbi:anhydro-N-acetylmuramic acid kinase [Lacinutrix sp. C3R15]|uniref:anhydro-N-acetylmuramic acid kinase n=1 Tax=Flavobacteriaceae TaxID=49546 RepID=UPI001C097628|nr:MULTISPECIES: anhydro-N-acetylmuramic acid kinase [Flavobacteriaceae]MBU2938435.1 anhydro-N-acetylmuramic acid kinase [Lacinutrix sp. C3R15]MDO6621749.1 anhydro-N-acetylmuramic acid kinase [Oceanihabitans sp. 1_MG-2023]
MLNNEYKIIGVMSGTSLDGIDVAYIIFNFKTTWEFKIKYSTTIPYTKEWMQILQNLIANTSDGLQEIDSKYTIYVAQVINSFIQENNIQDIDAICSHGHTALHQPEKGLTYQIGNLKALATLTKTKVVCDFRVQDVALGGQGAPLVPIGDKLLFSKYHYCVNLGGFANISFEENKKRIAFDICPVNIVLNHYVQKLGVEFDDQGKLAATGNINIQLLEQLNNLDFYKEPYPKSLGLEWVKKEVLPIIDAFAIEIKDILKTVVAHIAIQITKEINKKENATVLITGGGAYNTYLINQIKNKTNNKVIIPCSEIINYKEALIFGLLGVLKLREEINCLSSVTGARNNHSSGKIYLP